MGFLGGPNELELAIFNQFLSISEQFFIAMLLCLQYWSRKYVKYSITSAIYDIVMLSVSLISFYVND